jgi:predicted nucleic acid-binding protein
MLAVDTNVVVRYLTRDHPEEALRAKRLTDATDILVATTVLLESEWVLRARYGFGRDQTLAALRAFAGLPRVRLEDPADAAKALEWMAEGMDFADALHLAKAEGCEAFVSFDRRLAAAAGGSAPEPRRGRRSLAIVGLRAFRPRFDAMIMLGMT